MSTAIVPYAREIKLTQGKVALVGWWWYEWLMQWKWHVQKMINGEYYAVRTQRKILMHRVISNPSINQLTDHKDRIPLNNLESNLRNCTRTQNNANKKHSRKVLYLGVSKSARTRAVMTKTKGARVYIDKAIFKATLRINNNRIFLGGFETAEAAALAYNKAAIKYHGEFANLNQI